jgi:hypothetical protein
VIEQRRHGVHTSCARGKMQRRGPARGDRFGVAAGVEESPDDGAVSIFAGDMQWRVIANAGPRLERRAGLDQLHGRGHVTTTRRPVKRRHAIGGVGALLRTDQRPAARCG